MSVPTNHNPVLTGKKATFTAGKEDTVYNINVKGKTGLLAGYTDSDGYTLNVTNVTANHGAMSFDAAKKIWKLAPDLNYNGLV